MRKALILILLLAACTRDFPEDYPEASFSGRLYVLWVGEGKGSEGDGNFVFIPDARARLTLHRKGARDLSPEMMYTDGGSIPRLAQVFNGLQPWGYAPAYMIHDWLFVAHHCQDKVAETPAYGQVTGMKFEETVTVMGAALRALMDARRVKHNDIAGARITWAVGGQEARRRWNDARTCKDVQVKPEDEAAALALIPAEARPKNKRNIATLRALTAAPPPPAKLIATVQF